MDLTLIFTKIILESMGLRGFSPATSKSTKWKTWVAVISLKTCWFCFEQHGKIYDRDHLPRPKPPVHLNCRCKIEDLPAIIAGTATIDRYNGADYSLRYFRKLPKNYISKTVAQRMGWKRQKGNLRDVAPEATIGGDIFYNDRKKLPNAPGRVWYEADINYTGGKRNSHRIVYSNDGLIFVTYDHYFTFYEIK